MCLIKREKNGAEKEKEKTIEKMTKKSKKSTHKSKTKPKKTETHMYVSWSFVRKLCLQVDLRFAFTLFYR